MNKCIKCGSYAFNLYKEDIDQGGLCDVHYWQGRAHRAEALAEQPARQALDKMAENARELGLDYEPAQQEPVAWLKVIETPGGWGKFVEAKPHEKGAKPVYTSPQPAQRTWVGLTPEQRQAIAEANNTLVDDDLFDAIESLLKEKNT